MPPARMRGDGRKAKDPKKTLLRLLKYLTQYKLTLLIVVLDNGQISAVGSHEQLMQTSSIYQEVYYSQQKGGLE